MTDQIPLQPRKRIVVSVHDEQQAEIQTHNIAASPLNANPHGIPPLRIADQIRALFVAYATAYDEARQRREDLNEQQQKLRTDTEDAQRRRLTRLDQELDVISRNAEQAREAVVGFEHEVTVTTDQAPPRYDEQIDWGRVGDPGVSQARNITSAQLTALRQAIETYRLPPLHIPPPPTKWQRFLDWLRKTVRVR